MGEAVFLLALFGIGTALGYYVRGAPGANFKERFMAFFNPGRPRMH